MIWFRQHLAEILLVIIIFIPRLPGLNVFLTPDEPLFLEHARDMAAAFTSGDYSQTLGIGYPGVTVAGLAAPFVANIPDSMAAYAAGRFPVVLFGGLLLLVLYALARRLLGRWPALIGVSLLALDPYALSYSRLLHIAAPLALLMTLAGLSWLLWLRDSGRSWLLLTGLFTALALLTKSTALLLGPMLAVVTLSWAISRDQWRSRHWWFVIIAGAAVSILLAAVIFFLLWPAMWVVPGQALRLTFGKLFTDQEAGTGNLGMFWFGQFVQDPGPAFYPVAFLLKATPWLLIGLLLSLMQLANGARTRGNAATTFGLALALWLFALTYLIIMTVASKKSIRYMLPAFPTLYLLSGLAFHQFVQWLPRNHRLNNILSKPKTRRTWHSAAYLILLLTLIFTFTYYPYYFTYTNPLVLGWRWAPDTLLIGWGEGLDKAANYLNDHQPDAAVSTWYEWLFPYLYNGPVESVVPQENLLTASAAVLYINQVQRDIPGPNIIHYFRTRRIPEYTVGLNGIDYVWIYPGPIVGFGLDPALQVPLGGDFAEEARLLGYNLSPQPVAGGETLLVTLFWRVLSAPNADRFVFVRLVDAQGRIWAKTDGPPLMGLWPVARWQPDMLLEDAHELSIPAGIPPGLYRLEVGMYDVSRPELPRILPASGQPLGTGGGLLLGQVEAQWRSVTTESTLPWQSNIRLAPNARLIGYSSTTPVVTTGDTLNVTLDWREDSTLFSRWIETIPNDWVMFEWHQNGRRVAEQLEPLPLPIEAWGRNAVLRSQHTLIVPPSLESGQVDLFVMLHTSSDPAGQAYPIATLDVSAPAHQFDLPADAVHPINPIQLAGEANQTISLPVYQLFSSGQGLDVELYWQTDAPVTIPYKVFVQLLNQNGELVLQSDMVPGGGTRPVTGWLPGEVIADSHTLYTSGANPLPPGSYRLIVGLYNPVNGQRLPVRNAAGDVTGDAAIITEVTLP